MLNPLLFIPYPWLNSLGHFRVEVIKFILFWSNILHVSDGLSIHHQELKTVHTTTGIFETDTAVCLLVGAR